MWRKIRGHWLYGVKKEEHSKLEWNRKLSKHIYKISGRSYLWKVNVKLLRMRNFEAKRALMRNFEAKKYNML